MEVKFFFISAVHPLKEAQFYQDLPVIEDFQNVLEDRYFRDVPPEWYVIVTDVKNSTGAIQEGRYKDVNIVGVAVVALVQEELKSLEFPFAFGGDGSRVLVPPSVLERIRGELRGLRILARDNFDLDLRVGAVRTEELYRENTSLKVGRYAINPDRTVAIFRGGGTDLAEQKIRENPNMYGVKSAEGNNIELTGLSCRWNEITSEKGTMLTLLIQSRSAQSSSVYRRIFSRMEDICGGNLSRVNPVSTSVMSYKSVLECIRDERRYTAQTWSISFLLRCLEIVLAVAVFKWNIPPFFFDPDEYVRSLPDHSDYRKFDDMLQLTIDCTDEKARKIEEYLDRMYRDGKLFYGVSRSDSCVITCFLQSVNQGDHIHFIDGGDGGYAMASIQLKDQISSAIDS